MNPLGKPPYVPDIPDIPTWYKSLLVHSYICRNEGDIGLCLPKQVVHLVETGGKKYTLCDCKCMCVYIKT
jgi:hypothetical protein